MQVGLFIPNVENGYIMSSASPRFRPTFPLMQTIVRLAERHGFNCAFSIAKYHASREAGVWVDALESMTLTAGLLHSTERIKIYASAAISIVHPAVAARSLATLDSIAPGRTGINIVAGGDLREYYSLGLLRRDHARTRYVRAAEYVQILRSIWTTGSCTLDGQFYQLDDCQGIVMPEPPKVLCAGQSAEGLAFSAVHGDTAMIAAYGVNDPAGVAPTVAQARAAAQRVGRSIQIFVLLMIVAAPTDEEAWAKWRRYEAGAKAPGMYVNGGMLALIGSFKSVAGMLDTLSAIEGVAGVWLSFDDYLQGIHDFGTRIQPQMASRQDACDG